MKEQSKNRFPRNIIIFAIFSALAGWIGIALKKTTGLADPTKNLWMLVFLLLPPLTGTLPRASGLVHHGGFGTTSSGFRAGIPMLVIPHIIDQFIWENKVAQLGVGPQPIARPKLNAANMAAALREMQSPAMRQKPPPWALPYAPSRMG